MPALRTGRKPRKLITRQPLHRSQEVRGGYQRQHRGHRLNPQYTNAYYWRADALYFLKRYKEAIEDYSVVIRLNPTYHDAYVKRGHAYREVGDVSAMAEDAAAVERPQPPSK